MLCLFSMLFFSLFFFKQKTAYEMRISDWSSDVCSSDLMNMRMLRPAALIDVNAVPGLDGIRVENGFVHIGALVRYHMIEKSDVIRDHKIGRASRRESVCQYVYIPFLALSLTKTISTSYLSTTTTKPIYLRKLIKY